METEQFYVFLSYKIYDTYTELNENGQKVYIDKINIKRISKTRGPKTDYDRYRRSRIDFDPIDHNYLWAVYILIEGKEKNVLRRGIVKDVGVFLTEAEANNAIQRFNNGESKYFLDKGESLLSINKVFLPVIDDQKEF